jgi:hypothetical protein
MCGQPIKAGRKIFRIRNVVVLAALFVVLCGIFYGLVGLGKSGKTQLVYFKGDALYYVSDIDKEKEPYCITELTFSQEVEEPSSAQSSVGIVCENAKAQMHSLTEGVSSGANVIGNRAVFSTDEKYIYFFSDYTYNDDNLIVASLYRIPTKKIKAEKKKNQAAIEKILDGINAAVLLEDGSALGMTVSEGKVKCFYYAKKKVYEYEVANGWGMRNTPYFNQFSTNMDIVTKSYEKTDDGRYNFCFSKYNRKGENTDINLSNCREARYSKSEDAVYYTVAVNTHFSNLYRQKFGGEPELLAKNVVDSSVLWQLDRGVVAYYTDSGDGSGEGQTMQYILGSTKGDSGLGVEEFSFAGVSKAGNYLYFVGEDLTNLYYVPIEKGQAGRYKKLVEGGVLVYYAEEDGLYYWDNRDDGWYKYDGKNTECISLEGGVVVYENGWIRLGKKQEDEKGYTYTLQDKKGNLTKIGDKLRYCRIVDENHILYQEAEDNSLYITTG